MNFVLALVSELIYMYDRTASDDCSHYITAHKTKIWGEQKVLASAFHYLVYSAYADDDFYVVSMTSLKNVDMCKVHVFEEEAEWMNLDSHDHISDIAVAQAEKQVIVVNGKTQELLFFDLETRQQLKTLNKMQGVTIADMRYSLKEQCVYYTADNEVGQLRVGNQQITLKFRHPCKVTRVVSQDGRLVATIAEDNILRVWDNMMEPFQPDLSAITGQVHVKSDTQSSFSAMLGGMGLDIDTSSAMTSHDVKNYWTKDAKSSSNDKVHTKFHSLPGNLRYVVVTQSHYEAKVTRQWTRCMSIWDLATVQIMQRVFLPTLDEHALGTYYVHCMVDKHHAFIQQNGDDITFHLLNLNSWKTSILKTNKTVKKVWKAKSLCLQLKQSRN